MGTFAILHVRARGCARLHACKMFDFVYAMALKFESLKMRKIVNLIDFACCGRPVFRCHVLGEAKSMVLPRLSEEHVRRVRLRRERNFANTF